MGWLDKYISAGLSVFLKLEGVTGMSMEKKIYEIQKNTVEYNKWTYGGYKQGMTIGVDDSPELVKTFDSMEEAKKEFANPYYHSDVCEMQGLISRLYHVIEYVLWEQRVEVDEDGDMDYIQGEILEVSNMEALDDN